MVVQALLWQSSSSTSSQQRHLIPFFHCSQFYLVGLLEDRDWSPILRKSPIFVHLSRRARAGAELKEGVAGASPNCALPPSAPRAEPGSERRARAPGQGLLRERARSASPRLPDARPAPSSCRAPRAQPRRTLAQSNPARLSFPLYSAPTPDTP